ncbi:MAG: 50S ribosomal protein L2 [Candidatus Omnitrophica bacterium]|nr:50S ribosomal protein L2 [Candidatus Omnitrophota bacterium]MCM8829084.1 50S ribosomal protein L2 [Candidatus Omnitrophota bacterium]
MPLRKLNPVTNAQRHAILPDFKEITRKKPEKRLVVGKRKKGGRNNTGRITVRHRGGGHKKLYRIIDFKGRAVEGKVVSIEYDPNRTANIAMIQYVNGTRSYIIAPAGLKVGTRINCGDSAFIAPGNTLPLARIPEGSEIYNIELQPGKGGQLVRSAGCLAILVTKGDRFASVKLPSGEVRLISLECMATIGRVSNPEHKYVSLGKAGRTRWLGVRPTVRGVAMNPVDHPHGGGEGRGKGNISQTPWGKPTKGYKTRRPDKYSNKFIAQRRKK